MNPFESEQVRIRCVMMRGGTSKGLYFHLDDLPPHGPLRDRLLLRLMGSPDILQIDGLGGSRPITSKVAIISRSDRGDADVNYTFAQVEIEREQVIHSANCGNISAGVGPFAVDEKLVPVTEGMTRVRIYNTNTDKLLVADVPVCNGRAKVEGDLAIPGVPGTGAGILMNWAGTVGAKTGRLLPTGRAVDRIVLEDGRVIEATVCDVANPCVWVHAAALGLTGSELSEPINADTALIERVREVRGKAAVLFGFCNDWRQVDDSSPALPMVGLVAPPADYTTLNGAQVLGTDMDARVRLMFMNRLHESIAGAGAISVAAASRVEGSVVASVAAGRDAGTFFIGHPSGVMPVRIKAQVADAAPFVRFDVLGFSRTARRLMDCNAYYPRSLLEVQPEAVAPPQAFPSMPT